MMRLWNKFGDAMKLKVEKNILTKMIIAGIVGLTIIIIGGIIFASSLKTEDKGKVTSALPKQESDEELSQDAEKDKTYTRGLGLVTEVDKLNQKMVIVDVDTSTSLTLKVTAATSIEDEYGTHIVLEKIIPGYLVNVKYEVDDYVTESIKIAAQVQTIRNIDNFVANEELKTIQIGSDIYEYDHNILVENSEGPVEISKLSVADDIVVRAHEGKIWSILVENGHGFLVLKNYESYIDGRLEIGNRESHTIVRDMKVPIKAGVHQIVVTNEQMTPYSASVFIEENEEFVVDLGELAARVATVRLEIVQPDATVYIDDKKIDNPTQERQLDYGEYSVRVESPGYVSWEGILVVDQAYIAQRIDMEVEPLYIYISGPAGANFYVDNVLKGTLEANKPLGVPITPGGHTLQLRKTDYNTWERNVFIEDTGEDYYYTVSSMTEIPTVPVPTPDQGNGQTPNDPTQPNANQNDGTGTTNPVQDVYGN